MNGDVNDSRDRPAIWFRVLLPRGALGPGKIALMRLIGNMGSVSAAARALRMSHARSIKLVAEMNALGSGPLIQTRTGGDAGGGASLTMRGVAVLAAYDMLEQSVQVAIDPALAMVAAALIDDDTAPPPAV